MLTTGPYRFLHAASPGKPVAATIRIQIRISINMIAEYPELGECKDSMRLYQTSQAGRTISKLD
jgi:hypothetical protein